MHGNHDVWVREALDAESLLVRTLGDTTAVLVHGDAYDPVLGAAPTLSHAATWFTGRLRWAGLRWPAEFLEERDVQLKAQRFQGPDGPYASGARQLSRDHGAQVVVMGHTHVPTLVDARGVVLANTGTCSRGRFMGVSLDLLAREARLFGAGACNERDRSLGWTIPARRDGAQRAPVYQTISPSRSRGLPE